MRRIFLTITFLILFGTLVLVGYLGYFNTPDMKVTTAPEYFMAGKAFKGGIKDKSFGQLFQEADSLILKEGVKGKVAVILDRNPMKITDTMTAFVGVLLDDSSSAPAGYDLRKVPSRKVLQADITGHFLLLPTNIYEKIIKHAEENVLEISTDGAIEIYEGEEKLIVQVPVR